MEKKGQVCLFPLGDRGIVVQFGARVHPTTYLQIQELTQALEKNPFPGYQECVPAFTTVTVYYDPVYPYSVIEKEIQKRLMEGESKECTPSRHICIPVCYGGDFGPDLIDVAQYHQKTPEEIIHLHSKGDYLVYMLGFSPGFPYMGGMPKELTTPRKSSPRLKVPAGSVGIGGEQTGIYPMESPGGWNLIGQTPLSLFQPQKRPPVLLSAGDRVTFVPISPEEFRDIRQKEGEDEFSCRPSGLINNHSR